MRPGRDGLGMAHKLYPFGKFLQETPLDTPIGWFWSQFGDSAEHFITMLDKGYTIFRPQMYWNDNHIIVPMNVLNAELRELKKVVDQHAQKSIQLYISPSCEHAETNRNEVLKRLQLTREYFPNALAVNNPVYAKNMKGARVPGFLHEGHGSNPSAGGPVDLASTDGTNIYDIDAASWVKKYGNTVHPCFLWGYRDNLREIGDLGQKAPSIPNRKAAPSVEWLRSVDRLCDPMGDAPKPSFKVNRNLQENEIYKTHAEDDQELRETDPDEKRENRPTLIIKPNAGSVDILASNGDVIGKLIRYGKGGDFAGGLTRYYSGLPGGIGVYGYQIGNQAKKKSGSEFVWYRAGKTIIGPIHPAFRAGIFRD